MPFAAGGPTDTHSRWAAQRLNAAFGQAVVVEKRGGAGGVIGTEAVARAAPDGYTLLGGNPGPLIIAPNVRKQLAYDGVRDFAPITLIARSASCMCAHPSVPAKGVQEFIALAKANPGKINYATPGVGTVGHFAIESVATLGGIKMTMIPYKGAALYIVDLIAGHIDFAQIQIFKTSLSVPGHQIMWILGVNSLDAALKRLEPFRLEGVMQRMRCPFLLVHGADDEQIPLADAQKQFDACGSQDKTLRVFTAEEGGAQHCQRDYLTLVVAEMWNWFEDKLLRD